MVVAVIFLGEIGMDQDLVVVAMARSVWLWICIFDLVVGGDEFANRFWPWVCS